MNLYRKTNLFVILILISLSTFAQESGDIRQKIKPPYNIKDYFLLMPDSLLKIYEGNVSLKQRQLALKYKTLEDLWKHGAYWIIDTLDYRNGYMKLSSTGDGEGTYFEICYFIKKDKSREIAVNTTHWDLAESSSEMKFYSFKNKKWTDITSEVLPVISLSDFLNSELAGIIKDNTEKFPVVFALPEKGKTILAKIDMGTIDMLLENNKIDEVEYRNIKTAAKPIKLIWKDGIFKLQK